MAETHESERLSPNDVGQVIDNILAHCQWVRQNVEPKAERVINTIESIAASLDPRLKIKVEMKRQTGHEFVIPVHIEIVGAHGNIATVYVETLDLKPMQKIKGVWTDEYLDGLTLRKGEGTCTIDSSEDDIRVAVESAVLRGLKENFDQQSSSEAIYGPALEMIEEEEEEWRKKIRALDLPL